MTGDSRLFPDSFQIPCDFMRETDYRISRLQSWIQSLRGKRIALYGSGANARHILDADCPGIEICSIIDNDHTGKELCGRTVVDFESAIAQGIDAIIAAAEFKSSTVIAKRLFEGCKASNILLFDMYGNNLLELGEEIDGITKQGLGDQLTIIESSDILCIDIDIFTTLSSQRTVSECMRDGDGLDRCICHVTDYFLAQRKRIVVTSSDPAITRERVAEILDGFGLDDCTILCATELGLWAENGLYRILYDNYPGKSVTHIGHDLYRDCLIPLSYGANAILIAPITDPLYLQYADFAFQEPERGSWLASIDKRSITDAEARLCNCAESIESHLVQQFGVSTGRSVMILAPLVVGYVTWLIHELEQSQTDFDEVLFVSRDALIIRKVYELFRANLVDSCLPHSRYFLSSRLACLEAVAPGEASTASRRNMLAYFDSCNLKLGGSYAFVDFVVMGTCQHCLEIIAPFLLKGFYFGSRAPAHIECTLDAEFYFSCDDRQFFSRFLLLEPFLSAEEPSLAGFSEDGTPIFAEEHRTDRELAILRDIQEGITLFAKDYIARWFQAGDVIGHSFLDSIMPFIDAHASDVSMKLYNDTTGIEQSQKLGSSLMPAESSAGKEREHGIPSSSIHRDLLSMLSAFDAICTKHRLAYVATHGTLLGALRHKGIIPWDNDLDVAMPRSDYDKLLALFSQGEVSLPLFLQTPENDSTCFNGGHSRLYSLQQHGSTSTNDHSPSNQTAWIDIMPLDNCSADDNAVERRQKVVRIWQRALYSKTYGISRLWDSDPYKVSAYYALGDKLSRPLLCRLLKRACIAEKHTGLLTIFASNYTLSSNTVRFSEEDVLNAERLPFAGTTIPVPRHAEEWLARYYGDGWKRLPYSPWVMDDGSTCIDSDTPLVFHKSD